MKVLEGLPFDLQGVPFKLNVEISTYAVGDGLTIQLTSYDPDGYSEPFGTLTVNLPDDHLDDGEVFIKDWSENEELVAWAREQKILGEPTGRTVRSGYVQVPVYRLHPDFVLACARVIVSPELDRWLARTAATVEKHKIRNGG